MQGSGGDRQEVHLPDQFSEPDCAPELAQRPQHLPHGLGFLTHSSSDTGTASNIG